MGSINPETLQIWETSSGSEENLHPYGYAGGGFTVLSDTFTESQVIFYISLGQQGHLGGGGGNYPFAPTWDSSVVRGRGQSRIKFRIIDRFVNNPIHIFYRFEILSNSS